MTIVYRFIYIIATLVSPFIIPSIAMANSSGAIMNASLSIALVLINALFMMITFLLFFRLSEKQHGNSDEDIFLISFMFMILIDYGVYAWISS